MLTFAFIQNLCGEYYAYLMKVLLECIRKRSFLGAFPISLLAPLFPSQMGVSSII